MDSRKVIGVGLLLLLKQVSTALRQKRCLLTPLKEPWSGSQGSLPPSSHGTKDNIDAQSSASTL